MYRFDTRKPAAREAALIAEGEALYSTLTQGERTDALLDFTYWNEDLLWWRATAENDADWAGDWWWRCFVVDLARRARVSSALGQRLGINWHGLHVHTYAWSNLDNADRFEERRLSLLRARYA